MTRRQSEDKQLNAYYKWLKAKQWDTNYYHVANELPAYSKEMQRFAAVLKHKGKKPGVSDIIIFEPHQGYAALFVELKTVEGEPSFEQLVFLHNGNNNGFIGVVAYGLKAAVAITEWYMSDSKEKPPYQEVEVTKKGINFKVLEAR